MPRALTTSTQLRFSIVALLLGYAMVAANTLAWQNPAVGVPGFVLLVLGALGCIRIFILSNADHPWVFVALAFASGLMITNAIAVYFFRYTQLYALFTLGCLVLYIFGMSVYRLSHGSVPLLTVHESRGYHSRAFSLAPFILIVIGAFAAALYVAQLFQVSFGPALYHGALPTPAVPYVWLVAIIFACLFVSYLKRLPVYTSITLSILLVLAAGMLYRATLHVPYGADSWRHIAIESYIAAEHRYEPTAIIELLKFRSEKLPNGLQYTIVASVHTYTGVSIALLHQYLSLIIYTSLFMVALSYLRKRYFEAFQTPLLLAAALAMQATAYIAQLSNPQSLGLVLFLVNLVVWLQYVRRELIPWYVLLPISVVALLAYPTTGYVSALIVLVGFGARHLRAVRWNALHIVWLSFLGIIAALPIFFADRLLKNIPLLSVYSEHWWSIAQTAKHWYQQVMYLSINNLEIVLVGFAVLGLVYLFKEHRSSFSLFFVPLVAVRVALWFRVAFTGDTLPPFSDRLNLLYTVLLIVPVALGLVFVAKRFVQMRLRSGVLALFLVTLFISFFSLDPSQQTFGWSVTQAEEGALAYIQRSAPAHYIVLADEVTSAVGSARTNLYAGYYWYPDGALRDAYLELLRVPQRKTLQGICQRLQPTKIYFIDTPIPPTASYPESQKALGQVMHLEWQKDRTRVFSYACHD